MKDDTLDFTDYLAAFKRRRASILVTAVVVFTVGALAALLWPATYKSSATILIKEQDIPPEMVRSTVTSFASQRIQAISQRVMARPNLLEIIDKYNLYTDERQRLTTEEVIAKMRDNIGLSLIDANVVDPRTGRPTSATIAFQLGFSGEDPSQVQKVANELMSLYLKENIKERAEKASETYTFLNDESKRLSNEISTLEARLAAFKEKHVNSLPELRDLNQSMLDRTERELSSLDGEIRALNQTRIYLDSQLAQLKPYGSDPSVDPKTRLQSLRTQYLALIARYSPDHPDVIRTRREIEGLEQQTGQVSSSAEQLKAIEALRSDLSTLLKKYSTDHPDVVKIKKQIQSLEQSVATGNKPLKPALASSAAENPDNPAYIQLQTQMESTHTQIRLMKKKKAELEARVSEYERRLVETPQVEREFRQLARELRNSTTEYDNIHAKLVSAEIAQELEKDSKGERFEIIEPPIFPEEPVSPNRPAILFLSLVLALGCGIGFAAIAESLDDAVHGNKSVMTIVGTAPLAVIPYMATDSEISHRKRRAVTRFTAAAAVVILSIAAVHFFWQPLDVLWYKALRKADVAINT